MTQTQPRLGNGTFTFAPPNPEGAPLDLTDSAFFAEGTAAEQEAAAAYAAAFPGVTAATIERKLFDTYETADEYQADVDDDSSELMILADKLQVFELPSGGVGVFWA